MWELDHKESWAPKHWCFWTVELEKTPRSPLDCKEIQPLNPKGNQSWIFIGRTDAEAPILRPPDAKSWLISKDPDAGKDWRQEKETTEDEMVGWHHRFNGHGFGDGQGSLACCSPWGCKELDTTERLNWTELIRSSISLSFPPSSQKVLLQIGLGLLVMASLTLDSMNLSYLLMLWLHILPSFHQEARQAAAWFYPEAHGLSQTQDSCCNKQHRDACSFLHPHLKKIKKTKEMVTRIRWGHLRSWFTPTQTWAKSTKKDSD